MIRAAIMAMLFLTGCQSATMPEQPKPAAVAPAGAVIGSEGFATIGDVPPAPATSGPAQMPPPPRMTDDQHAAGEQFARAGRFQNEVMDEVQALTDRLRRSEPGNFVDLYYENEGDPHVVFRFLRDPERALRRYTRNPKFVSAKADYSSEQLRAANDYMWRTFGPDRVIQASGMGNKANRVEVEISVPEAEFRALAAKKGAVIPAPVQLRFPQRQSATEINRPLAPGIAPLVRAFPRDNRPAGMLNLIMSQARVVLDDGCFRVRGGPHDGALVVFPLGAGLFIDRQNYLAFGDGERPGYARVGEELTFPGSIGEVTAPDLVAPVRQVCGAGRIVKINGMNSASADRAASAISDNQNALRQLRETYGLSAADAQRALDRCIRQMGGGRCLLSPPPPAIPSSCPKGTRLSYGLCRTPQGVVRPLPQWIEQLLASE